VSAEEADEGIYEGSTLEELRRAMEDKPFTEDGHLVVERLPRNPFIDINYVGSRLWSPRRGHFQFNRKLLERQSHRILEDRRDTFERSPRKGIHPNGICFIGEWEIDVDTGLTGYFAAGAKGLFVGRAAMMDNVVLKAPGVHRAAGFAGKILPTMDPSERVRTANFVMIDTFFGRDQYYLESSPTNNPSITELGLMGTIRTGSTGVVKLLRILELGGVLGSADIAPTYRPLGQISHLGLSSRTPARTPVWMRISYVAGVEPAQRYPDFRQELWETLRLAGSLVFSIEVSKHVVEDAPDAAEFLSRANLKETIASTPDFAWLPIGRITLREPFLSEGADHRVRFHHDRVLEPSYEQG
jgi:hypothetical protein